MGETESEATGERQKASPEPSAPSGETLLKKLLYAIVGFLLTGVVGGFLTNLFQTRSWSYENSVKRLDEDAKQALASQQDVTKIITKRRFVFLNMVQALESNAAGKDWKAAWDDYSSVAVEWELNQNNLAWQIEYYVDAPFGLDRGEKIAPVYKLDCLTYTLAGGDRPDASVAGILLEVSNHCHALIIDDLKTVIAAKNAGKSIGDPKSLKKLLDDSNLRLEHIWHVHAVLRCTLVKRAVAIRHEPDPSFVNSMLGRDPPIGYSLPDDAPDCLRDYREHWKLGLASLKSP
jgi:hypothetical protein